MAFCNKCGNFMEEEQQFCTKCGFNKNSSVVPGGAVRIPRVKSPAAAVNLKAVMIMAVVQFLSVLFVPMINMFPAGPFYNDANVFSVKVLELVAEHGLGDVLEVSLTRLPVLGFVFTIVVLIGALLKKKAVCLAGSALGFLGLLITLFELVSDVDAEFVFSFDSTCVCFGFWVVFILFAVEFVKLLKSR